MLPTPYFHADTQAVRFWVLIDGEPLGASVSPATLHHCFRPGAQNEAPLDTYLAFSAELEAAVRRRVAQGSIEPVMLREYDLRAQPPAVAA